MAFYVHKPARGGPLAEFVDLFWYYESAEAPGPGREMILPAGASEFVVRLGGDESRVSDYRDPRKSTVFSGALVTGAHSQPFVLDKREFDVFVGVHFKAGGAFPFFGGCAHALKDQHVSLGDLWGARAENLRSRLLEAVSVAAKFRIMEDYLIGELKRRPRVSHGAVRLALERYKDPEASVKVADLADEVGLSVRRFNQLFTEQVGLGPKLYQRVARFQNALLALRGQQDADWAELALAMGYYDQAHFVHEFRELSGFQPTAYLGVQGEHLNHISLA